MTQHVLAPRRLALFGDQLLARQSNRSKLAHQSGDLGSLSQRARVAIEVVELFATAQQRHVLGLAVHVDEQFAQLLQDRARHSTTVDARASPAAAARDFAAHDQRAVFRLESVFVEDRFQLG